MFTEELTKRLEEIWKAGKVIKIKAISRYGEEFEIEGRVTTTDLEKPAIYQEIGAIYLEFGKRVEGKRSKYFTSFGTVPEEKYDFDFYILSIEDGDEVIFDNENEAQIRKVCELQTSKENERLKSVGRDQYPQCDVVEALKGMAGMPIIIDGTKAVVVGMNGVTIYGDPIVDLRVGPGKTCAFVRPETIILTEDVHGNVTFVAENDPEEFKKSRAEIVKNIKDTGNQR